MKGQVLMSTRTDEWMDFLRATANKVHGLVLVPENLSAFRERIAPLGKRWKPYGDALKREEKARERHWARVKADPRLQDKTAGPPKPGWEWDGGYLYHLGGPSEGGPRYEMPARHAPSVMEAIEQQIERTRQAVPSLAPNSHEERARHLELIEDLVRGLATMRDRYESLDPQDRGKAWIKVPPDVGDILSGRGYNEICWWMYLGLHPDVVFGCWRPKSDIRENPVHSLSFLWNRQSRPKDRDEECEWCHVTLAAIHDTIPRWGQMIAADLWPPDLLHELWYGLAQWHDLFLADDEAKQFIQEAMTTVGYDLSHQPNDRRVTDPAQPGGEEGSHAGQGASGSDPSDAKIPPRAVKAGQQYKQAVDVHDGAKLEDREAYEAITRAYRQANEENELPKFDTWQRNLREWRRLTGTQKKSRRAGRAAQARSLVKAEDIEPESLPTHLRSRGMDA